MSRHLPPLTSLRAFEAAARLLSFTKAAAELGVSVGAISHQIKQLEEYFAVELFKRVGRNLTLTAAGRACLPSMRAGFDQIAEAVKRIEAMEATNTVTLNVDAAFAAYWLLPRLRDFRDRYPNIDIEVLSRPLPRDASQKNSDIAIAYGSRNFSNVYVEHLMTEEVIPVVAAEPRKSRPLQKAADLAQFALIHDDTMLRAGFPSWEMWLNAANVHQVDTSRGMRFNSTDLAIQAALDGFGAVLGRSCVISGLIADQRLRPLRTFAYPVSFNYFLLATPAAVEQPHISILRDWLKAQAAAYAAPQRVRA